MSGRKSNNLGQSAVEQLSLPPLQTKTPSNPKLGKEGIVVVYIGD